MPLTAMNQAFYMQEPTVDTPYRQLVISKPVRGWRVQLTGGTRWGPKYKLKFKTIQAKTFKDAKEAYDIVFHKLLAEGWSPYTPGPVSSV